jgi:SAM-dependent methyltransferase
MKEENKPGECCATTTEKDLGQKFWDDQYKSDAMGWDMGEVSPPIKEYIDGLKDKNLRILIPGCGNTYEAEYLLQKGFTNITVIDIAPTLVNRLKEKFKGNPAIKILLADFFEHRGEYDLILEQTFFCALNPALRSNYRDKMFSLLSPMGKLVGVLFDRQFEQAGPPFGGTKDSYEKLFKDHFELSTFEKCRNSFHKRQDNELFIILKKKLIK